MFSVAAENLAGCGPYSEPNDGTKASDPIKVPSKPGKPNVMEVIAIYARKSFHCVIFTVFFLKRFLCSKYA